jgi:hypothetical protein
MVAVIVRVERSKLMSRRAALPEAMTTIIVSPIALPNPRTIDAAMPGAAAGTTTLRTVWARVDPIASAASRYERGTARNESSETEKTMGQIANASPMPATNALRRCSVPKIACTHVASTMSAKKPMTTEGTPASSSIAGFTTSRRRGPAYSDTNTAAATLMGTASTSATTVTFREPTMSGSTLYLGTSLTGCHTNAASPAWRIGANMLPSVTSRCTSALVSRGSASLPTKTRISKIAASEISATVRIAISAVRSAHRPRRRRDRERGA